MVVASTNPKIPHFNAPIYLENKVRIANFTTSAFRFPTLLTLPHCRLRLARSMKYSDLLIKFTSRSSLPRVFRRPLSSPATSSIFRPRNCPPWRNSFLSPSPRRTRPTRSRSPVRRVVLPAAVAVVVRAVVAVAAVAVLLVVVRVAVVPVEVVAAVVVSRAVVSVVAGANKCFVCHSEMAFKRSMIPSCMY